MQKYSPCTNIICRFQIHLFVHVGVECPGAYEEAVHLVTSGAYEEAVHLVTVETVQKSF